MRRNNMEFRKASKKQSKLMLAIFGTSGSGKTYGALRIATGMASVTKDKILLIDTEHRSSELYADKFDFDIGDMSDDKSIAALISVLNQAKDAKYGIVIIDSLSHSWAELLEEINKLADTKFSGNTWAAWSKGTPKQKKLIEVILNYPGHIIATMRVKTEWVIEQNEKGKTTIKRKGLNPEAGKGIEYEFSMLFEVDGDHNYIVTKDRTGKYQDKIIEKIDEKFGKDLICWLNTGEVEKQKPTESKKPQLIDVINSIEDDLKKNEFLTVLASTKKIKNENERNEIITALREGVKAYIESINTKENEANASIEKGIKNLDGVLSDDKVEEKFNELVNNNINELKKDMHQDDYPGII
jgi:adenylate kinase family enzyme